MKDRDLCLSLLQSARLSNGQREYFQRELLRIESFDGKLSTKNRQHAEAIARAQGLMPPLKERPKRSEQHRCDDPYSSQETPGTRFAARLLSQPMPAPVNRQRAS